MATLTGLITAVSEPTGLWAIIISAFESGVGSYILAVLLLTLIIRVVWAPVDLVNKKFSKKMTRNQAKLQPQLEKIEKQYAKDPQMLNKKRQELYKKANAGLGGGCLFMVVFMALNLTIFGSMFTTMNAFSSYKVNQQYENMKFAYANILNLVDNQNDAKILEIVDSYEDITVSIGDNTITFFKGENAIAQGEYKTDYSKTVEITNEDGTKGTSVKKSEVYIGELINRLIVNDEDDETQFIGDNKASDGETKYSEAIQAIAQKYVNSLYENVQAENSFLWIGNIWVADSPLNKSVLDYNGYKALVGEGNVAENEEVIYNSFMTEIASTYNRTNGYFILAILSIAVTFLSVLISNGINKKKNPQPQVKQNKLMYLFMPIIMGIFALMYNSVFAFYLVISQAMGVLLSPLQNYFVDKWEAHDMKKEEKKLEVEYSRKKI